MLGEKVTFLGNGLPEYYCICAVLGLVKKHHSQDNTGAAGRIAAERVSHMYQKILGSQDNYSAAATLASLPNMVCSSLLASWGGEC